MEKKHIQKMWGADDVGAVKSYEISAPGGLSRSHFRLSHPSIYLLPSRTEPLSPPRIVETQHHTRFLILEAWKQGIK